MKRMFILATAALLFTGTSFARDGGKKKKTTKKTCCKKGGSCSKDKSKTVKM